MTIPDQDDPYDAASRSDELITAAAGIVANPAGVSREALMLAHAITRAVHGWPVFPLRGKVPAIRSPHPDGSIERLECRGECDLAGHGVLDATTDIDRICRWWNDLPGANIGGRLPVGVFALDSDPQKPGHAEAVGKLLSKYGPLPHTLTTISGRRSGGTHRFYLRPPGKLYTARLGPGWDIKDSRGYVVLPPSIHPDTGLPYIEVDAPIIAPPDWLIDLITAPPEVPTVHAKEFFSNRCGGGGTFDGGESIADLFTDNTSWAEVLMPAGWSCRGDDPDADGAVWLHPTHTSNCSATIRHGYLFVYSTSTPFEVTEAGSPRGYTRFEAFAVLNHGGDMSAAARALRLRKVG